MQVRALIIALLLSSPAFAQAPPSTGGYTFQGQGNLPAILSSLANPQINQIPIGNGQNGFSLIQPFGDLIPSPNGPLGDYNVTGAHYGITTCQSTPCTIASTVVLCNAAAGNIVLNLPGAAGTGVFYWVSKTDSTSNVCTITAGGSDLINGFGSTGLSTKGQGVLLDDSALGTWLAALVAPVAASNTTGSGFPLSGSANANNFSIVNIDNLGLVALGPPTPASCNAICTGTCATTYTYKFTTTGDNNTQTNVSGPVTCTNAATLSTTNHNVLTWTLATGSKQVNIYGRVANALGLLASCSGTAGFCTPTTYNDNGHATVGVAPPAYNHTGMAISNGFLGAEVPVMSNANTNSLTGTVYLPFQGSTPALASEVLAQQTIGLQGQVLSLYCTINPSSSMTFTVRHNGVSTNLSCAISGGTSCNDITEADSFAATSGDLLDYQVVVTGATAEGGCGVMVLD